MDFNNLFIIGDHVKVIKFDESDDAGIGRKFEYQYAVGRTGRIIDTSNVYLQVLMDYDDSDRSKRLLLHRYEVAKIQD